MNCDNCKKKVSLFVPYVTVFLNNFLHLLLNRCDVKLKPILIDCSVFYFTGFRFHAFSLTFPFCFGKFHGENFIVRKCDFDFKTNISMKNCW